MPSPCFTSESIPGAQVPHHWAQPVVYLDGVNDRGPVLTLIEYQIQPADREAFLKAMQALSVCHDRGSSSGNLRGSPISLHRATMAGNPRLAGKTGTTEPA